MQNTLELKHLVYGFKKQGVEDVKSIDDIETVVEAILQATVWEDSSGLKSVKAIMEINLRDHDLDKAARKLKNLAKQHGPVNVQVKPVFKYCGR